MDRILLVCVRKSRNVRDGIYSDIMSVCVGSCKQKGGERERERGREPDIVDQNPHLHSCTYRLTHSLIYFFTNVDL